MSDLQCAATLLLVAAHSDAGDGATRLGGAVADRNVATLWSSPDPASVRTAEVVAARLGRTTSVHDGLGSTAGVADVLGEAADLHRGETVLLVAPADVLTTALPAHLTNLSARHVDDLSLGGGALVEVSADSEQWICVSWAGHDLLR